MTSHQNAADIALAYSRALQESTAMLTKTPSGREYVQAYVNVALSGGEMDSLPHGLALRGTPQAMREAKFIAMDEGTRRLWAKHRIVYDIDPDLWDSLADIDDDTVIPSGLMRQLPHPDPFVAFPKPIRLPLSKGDYMLVEGFFVSGRRHAYAEDGVTVVGPLGVSTHAPMANGELGLLIGGPSFKSDGTPVMAWFGGPDTIWNRVGLRTGGGDTTVGAVVEAIRTSGFSYYPGLGTFEDTVAPLIRAATAALMYLCAQNAELTPLPAAGRLAAKRAGGGKQGAVKPPSVVTVGYRIGAALRAHRRKVEEGASTPGTGRKMPPHMRRAHLHTFLYGKGKTERYVKWLPPRGVNMDLDDGKTVTVVPVDKPKTAAKR